MTMGRHGKLTSSNLAHHQSTKVLVKSSKFCCSVTNFCLRFTPFYQYLYWVMEFTPWLTGRLCLRSGGNFGQMPFRPPSLTFLWFELTTHCTQIMYSDHSAMTAPMPSLIQMFYYSCLLQKGALSFAFEDEEAEEEEEIEIKPKKRLGELTRHNICIVQTLGLTYWR